MHLRPFAAVEICDLIRLRETGGGEEQINSSSFRPRSCSSGGDATHVSSAGAHLLRAAPLGVAAPTPRGHLAAMGTRVSHASRIVAAQLQDENAGAIAIASAFQASGFDSSASNARGLSFIALLRRRRRRRRATRLAGNLLRAARELPIQQARRLGRGGSPCAADAQ